MNEDERLVAQYRALSPSSTQVDRLQVNVIDGWARHPRPLWREWINLLRARPLQNTSWALAAALLLFLTTPIGNIVGSLLRVQIAAGQLTQVIKPATHLLASATGARASTRSHRIFRTAMVHPAMSGPVDPARIGFPSDWAKTEFPSYGPAWDRAIAYGIDVSLLLENLERAPAQRLAQLQQVVDFHALLRDAHRTDK